MAPTTLSRFHSPPAPNHHTCSQAAETLMPSTKMLITACSRLSIDSLILVVSNLKPVPETGEDKGSKVISEQQSKPHSTLLVLPLHQC